MRWLAAAALPLFVLAAACGGDDGGDATDTPTLRPSASATTAPSHTAPPTSSPAPTPQAEVTELHTGEPVDFPTDKAFIIGTGCYGCDGPISSIVRMYRDPSGAVRRDVLFDPSTLGYPDLAENGVSRPPYITGFSTEPDGSRMVVSVCINKICGSGGLDSWNAESESVILVSDDGGVSWSEVGRAGPIGGVLGYIDGQAVASVVSESLGQPQWVLVPSGTELTPPPGGSWPITVNSQLLWRSDDDGLLLNDGSEFIRLPTEDYPEGGYLLGIAGQFSGLDKGSGVVSWTGMESLSSSDFVFTWFDVNGGSIEFTRHVKTQAFGHPALPDRTTDSSSAFVTIETLIGQLDMTTGEFRPLDTGLDNGRNHLVAYQTGPFARVVDTGECLNVRLTPTLSGEVATCVTDGVLVTDSGQTAQADGVTWIGVTTPNRTFGWASATYLER